MKGKLELVFFSLLIFVLLGIVFVVPNVQGVMYENGNDEATYFVSTPEPTIFIEISSGTKDIIVDKGVLILGNERKNMNVSSKRELKKFETNKYIFNIDEDVTKNNVKFKLNVYDKETFEFIKPMGDPIDFSIVYDITKPELVDLSYDFSSNKKYLVLEFNEILKSLKVELNNKNVLNRDIKSNPEFFTSKIIKVDISNLDLDGEENKLVLEFEDLAENFNSIEKELDSPGTILEVKLLTLKDDSTLTYYYNLKEEFKELFEKTIFSSSSSFDLKLRTTKKANCYFSSGIDMASGFPELSQVRTKKDFETENNLVHTISVSTSLDKKIWVVCQSVSEGEEVVYLSESLGFGKDLVNLKLYDKGDLKITMSEPNTLVSNNPFSLFVDTNNKALCFYDVDSKFKGVLNTSNYLNHQKGDIKTREGVVKIKFECEDVLGNNKVVQNSVDVDPSKGVKILSYKPKYTSSSEVTVEFFLSEFKDVSCRYSLTRTSKSDFDSLNNISTSGIDRNQGTFKINGLTEGENEIFVYCKKVPEIVENSLKIIYDTKGVIISNFSFVNGNYAGDFVSSKNEIKFKFLTQSVIPIKSYNVEIYGLDGKIIQTQNFTGTSMSLKGDFSNASKLKLVGLNELDVKGSLEKNIVFDLTPPSIDITFIENNLRIICIDHESMCSEVFYGVGVTRTDCQANKKYSNENIDTLGNNYLCVEAFNFAGLKSEVVKSLSNDNFGDIISTNPKNNSSNLSELNETSFDFPDYEEEDENQTDFDDDDPYSKTDFPDPNETGGINYILIAAVVLIFAGIGGGGFYAYKKGYLDKELSKLGIKLNKNKSSGSNGGISSNVKSNSNVQTNTKSNLPENNVKFESKPIQNKKQVEESSYDKHLKKLNSFIDDKISKSKSSFDKFDTISKGKTKGYEDSMIDNDKFKTKKVEKDEDKFDEFYTKSSSEKSIKDNSDSFEEYQKKNKK